MDETNGLIQIFERRRNTRIHTFTAHLSAAGRIHNSIREQSLQNGGGDYAALRVTRDDNEIGRVKRRKERRKLPIVQKEEGKDRMDENCAT
jgi:hypothetical protein